MLHPSTWRLLHGGVLDPCPRLSLPTIYRVAATGSPAVVLQLSLPPTSAHASAPPLLCLLWPPFVHVRPACLSSTEASYISSLLFSSPFASACLHTCHLTLKRLCRNVASLWLLWTAFVRVRFSLPLGLPPPKPSRCGRAAAARLVARGSIGAKSPLPDEAGMSATTADGATTRCSTSSGSSASSASSGSSASFAWSVSTNPPSSTGVSTATCSTTVATTSPSTSSSTVGGASELYAGGWDAVMFSEETRQHVLGLLDEGYPAADVADIIGCSGRSMRRWMRFFEENGSVWQDPQLRNLHADAAIRNPHLTRAVLTLVEKEPAAFLCDHVDLLVALSLDFPASDHRYVSAATVYRLLRYHQYTRKKIERLYAESSFIAQCAFAVMIDEIPLRCLVSCDETHTAGGDMLRRYGRSRRNVPCVLRDRDTRPLKRTSTMMGVSLSQGVLWSQMVIVGNAQTADDSRLFLQCLSMHMNT